MNNSSNWGKSIFLLINMLLVVVNANITILGFTNIESVFAFNTVQAITNVSIIVLLLFLLAFSLVIFDSNKNKMISFVISLIIIFIINKYKINIDVLILNFLRALKTLPNK